MLNTVVHHSQPNTCGTPSCLAAQQQPMGFSSQKMVMHFSRMTTSGMLERQLAACTARVRSKAHSGARRKVHCCACVHLTCS